MACKKCDPHEICEECPEWIFTLADLIMCMMGLFVLLWVLKESGAKAATPQEAKQIEQEWMHGFQQGFQGHIPSDANDPSNPRRRDGPGERGMARVVPDSPDGTESEASVIRPGREVTTGGKLLFGRGASTLDDDLQRRLDHVAELIRGHRQIVQVKGHAARDDAPDADASTRMTLSLRRAQAAADYLIARGVEPEVIRVQGCGTFEPIRQGDPSPAAQSVNRRVEVFVTDTLVEALQQDRQIAGEPVAPAPRHGTDD